MAVKKRVAKGVEKTRARVTNVISQARESLRLLEAIEKDAVAKAKTFVKIPLHVDRKKLANDRNGRILASLKRLGVASREEVDTLRMRVEKLEALVAAKEGTTSSTLPTA
jgi:hypothetical protein